MFKVHVKHGRCSSISTLFPWIRHGFFHLHPIHQLPLLLRFPLGIDDMAPTKVLADVWRNFSRFPRSRGATGFAEGILCILEGGHSVAGKKKNGGMKQQECC